MKYQEIQEKTQEELKALLQEEREKVRQLRFERAVKGTLKNAAALKKARKMVARIATALRQKSLDR